MTPERLQALIAAYGAEPAHWPTAERAAAETALREAADSQALLATERALDAILDAWPAPRVTLQLRERSLMGAPREGAERLGWRRIWLFGAGFTAACGAGLLVGITFIGPGLANAFPSEHGPSAGALADGLSVFGTPVDMGVSG
jgi:hypothetical protein